MYQKISIINWKKNILHKKLKGNDFFNKLGYAAAIPYFEKVQGTELESTELNEKLAYCYLFTSDLEKAESLYKKLISKARL